MSIETGYLILSVKFDGMIYLINLIRTCWHRFFTLSFNYMIRLLKFTYLLRFYISLQIMNNSRT